MPRSFHPDPTAVEDGLRLAAACGAGALGFLAAWARYGPGETQSQRWGLYVGGLAAVLLLAAGARAGLALLARLRPGFSALGPALGLGLFWAGLGLADGVSVGPQAYGACAGVAALLVALSILAWVRAPKRLPSLPWGLDLAWGLLLLAALLALARSTGAWTWGWQVLALFAALGWLQLRLLDWDGHFAWLDRRAARWALAGVLVLFCLPVILQEDRLHQGFYLGPVNNVLHGRSPLAEVQLQYGPGPVYLVAAVFKLGLLPFGMAPFTQLQAVLFAAQTLLLGAVLLTAFRSRLLALLGVAGLLVIDRAFSYQDWFVLSLPSMGPLRYAPALAPLLLAWRRLRPQGGSALGERLALGVAAAWSLETAAYAVLGYGAWTLLEQRPWEGRKAARAWAWQVLAAALAMVAGVLGLSLLTLARSGQWPDWAGYLGFFTYYGEGGIIEHRFNGRGAWLLPLGLCFGSFVLSLLSAPPQGERRRHALLFGAWGALGTLQLSYYMSRPHHSVLAHLAGPALLCGLYWVDHWRQDPGAPRALRLAAAWAVLALIPACGPKLLPGIARQARWTALGQMPGAAADLLRGRVPRAWTLWRSQLQGQGPRFEESKAALRLAAKHLDPKGPWTLLLSPGAAVEVQLEAQVIEHAPLANPEQDYINEHVRRRAADFGALKAGDKVLIGQSDDRLRVRPEAVEFQHRRRQTLEKAWILREIDRDGGVRVMELVRPR